MNKTLCTIKFGSTMTNQLVRLPEIDFIFLFYVVPKQSPILTRLSNSLIVYSTLLSRFVSAARLYFFSYDEHVHFHAKHEGPMDLMLQAVYSFFIFRLSSYHLMLCFSPIWKPSLTT
jgi:hypothetical protein